MADYHEQVLVEQNTVGKLEDDIKLLKINQEKEKQQAVKEFAEKLKAELWKFDGSWQEYDGEELCETVDNLIAELYGADDKERKEMVEKEIERIKQSLECCAEPIPNCEKCGIDCDCEGRRCYGMARLALDCIKWLQDTNKTYLNFYKAIYKEVFEDVFRCVKGSASEAEYTEIVLNNLKELAKIKYGIEPITNATQ